MNKTPPDTGRGGKRKGTRSVSTLSPQQLARKRANDREAQRAIRQRTKEHIESLERQVEEFRSGQTREILIQDLLMKNKALEDEIRRLRETFGLNRSSSGTLYQTAFQGTCSRTPPSIPSVPEYQGPHGSAGLHYSCMNDSGDAWPQTGASCPVSSTVSRPCSRDTDDYGPNYVTTAASMPSSMLDRSSLTPAMSSISSPATVSVSNRGGYEDVKNGIRKPLSHYLIAETEALTGM
ncbi:hypothetical protein DL762_005277 [Monosporascus cannonballus]|uniref:BZIP domain-containing protein n=1 Tax=Monosporascus cannonballus TaxID=155416 RepID=A0ABY0H5B8_9PEZI|nr:hypothetical protein DL762_005277 [Monosporascus cannonballus]RYO90422.1 hypothetical protein DL763_005342 [Monosporascus cannonballus]